MNNDVKEAIIVLIIIAIGLLIVISTGIGICYVAAKINIMEFTGRVDAIAKYVNPSDIATVIKELKK